MRGRNVSSACVLAKANAGGDIQTFLINWHGNQPAARKHKDPAAETISRLFEPDRITRVEKDTRGDVQGLLRTADHHNLIGVTFHRTHSSQVFGN